MSIERVTNLEKFYLTFGVQYAQEPHPRWEGADPDGWVLVLAPDEPRAREMVVNHFSVHWSMLYPGAHFDEKQSQERYYPLGELAVLDWATGELKLSREPRRLRRTEVQEE